MVLINYFRERRLKLETHNQRQLDELLNKGVQLELAHEVLKLTEGTDGLKSSFRSLELLAVSLPEVSSVSTGIAQ